MIREIAYKIKILRNNACVSTLEWDADDAPSVDMDSEAEIKSSLQGTFLINPDYGRVCLCHPKLFRGGLKPPDEH